MSPAGPFGACSSASLQAEALIGVLAVGLSHYLTTYLLACATVCPLPPHCYSAACNMPRWAKLAQLSTLRTQAEHAAERKTRYSSLAIRNQGMMASRCRGMGGQRRSRAQAGEDRRHDLTISFADAVFGCSVDIDVDKMET